MQIAVDSATGGQEQTVGTASVEDEGAAAVTRTLNFGPPLNGRPFARFAPSAPAPHTLSMFASLACGEEREERALTIESGGIDVIGIK